MAEPPRVGVVLPVHNGGTYLSPLDATLEEAMGQNSRSAACVLLQAGHAEEDIELLRTGRRLSKGRSGVAAVLAGVCSKQARQALRSGRLAAGLHWGMEAWRIQPSLPWQGLRGSRAGSAGAQA